MSLFNKLVAALRRVAQADQWCDGSRCDLGGRAFVVQGEALLVGRWRKASPSEIVVVGTGNLLEVGELARIVMRGAADGRTCSAVAEVRSASDCDVGVCEYVFSLRTVSLLGALECAEDSARGGASL